MAQFTDSLKRTWTLIITTWEFKNLREKLNVEILDYFDTAKEGSLSDKLTKQPDYIVDILGVLCVEQMKSYGATPESLYRLFDGGTCEAATIALGEAIVDFFQNSRQGPAMKKFLEMQKTLARMMDEQAATATAELTPEKMDEVAREMLKTLEERRQAGIEPLLPWKSSVTVTALRDTSESILTGIASENSNGCSKELAAS
jgi:hypothetical protein